MDIYKYDNSVSFRWAHNALMELLVDDQTVRVNYVNKEMECKFSQYVLKKSLFVKMVNLLSLGILKRVALYKNNSLQKRVKVLTNSPISNPFKNSLTQPQKQNSEQKVLLLEDVKPPVPEKIKTSVPEKVPTSVYLQNPNELSKFRNKPQLQITSLSIRYSGAKPLDSSYLLKNIQSLFPNLEELIIDGVGLVDGNCNQYTQPLKNLKKLTVINEKITNQGLDGLLEYAPSLEELSVGGNKILANVAMKKALARHPKLLRLDLASTSVEREKRLFSEVSSAHLKSLDLSRCKNLNAEDVKEILESFPCLSFLYLFNNPINPDDLPGETNPRVMI